MYKYNYNLIVLYVIMCVILTVFFIVTQVICGRGWFYKYCMSVCMCWLSQKVWGLASRYKEVGKTLANGMSFQNPKRCL